MLGFSIRSFGRASRAACLAIAAASLLLACAPAAAERAAQDGDTALAVSLQLSGAGPFRATLLADPPRLALDLDMAMVPQRVDRRFRTQPRGDGRVRLETPLPGPMAIDRAAMVHAVDGRAHLSLRLRRVSSRDFGALTDRAGGAAGSGPTPVSAAFVPRMTIALDPGHGGSDPGTTHGALHEADLMLTFAQELKADLLRTTEFDVILTRTEDRFVPLRTRRALARQAGADLFLSLHADGIEQGSATGATIYTHSNDATLPASVRYSATLRQAAVRTRAPQGQPGAAPMPDRPYRSQDLASALVGAMAAADLPLYKHPWQEADFVVLRMPDMPSVLVELGFLTEPSDRARIADPAWRARMAAALRRGVLGWAQQDAAQAALQVQ